MHDQALLAAIGEHAIVLHLATKDRATARTKLSKLRKAFLDENESFYDPSDGGDREPEIDAAMAERSAANKALRSARSRLAYAINKHIRAAAAIAQQRGSGEAS